MQIEERGLPSLFPMNLYMTSELTRALKWVDQIVCLRASLSKQLLTFAFLQIYCINEIQHILSNNHKQMVKKLDVVCSNACFLL